MAKKIITIVGLTGAQGGSVADVFLKERGWHVRGLTRDPSKPSSQAWATKGVELVKADLNDVFTLIPAFAQSTVIFGVTDFWELCGIRSTKRSQGLLADLSTRSPTI
ncbi:nmrA-like family protein [Colletotrichum tofieldiae]|nr:nmrA-like family protein [Colletotrichum tofieldiae]